MDVANGSGEQVWDTEAMERLRSQCRAQFPALDQPLVYFENAGGSQVPDAVADRVQRYFRESYVQLGAGYPLSAQCESVVTSAHAFVRELFHAGDARGSDPNGAVILGSSSSALLRTLAAAYRQVWKPGEAVVLAENGHEANIGPWLDLEEAGAEIRWWKVDRERGDCTMQGLEDSLTPKTRLVVFPHVSNLLGNVFDVEEATRRVHAAGAQVVVDGVAFAPHRALAVDTWGVDWYVFSTYKTYGPHMGALFGTDEAIAPLPGPNHFFIPESELPYKFEVGGVSHEGCAALLGTQEYCRFVAESTRPMLASGGGKGNEDGEELGLAQTGGVFRDLELPLQAALLEYLVAREDVVIYGPAVADDSRVATISFCVDGLSSKEVAARIQSKGFAVRHGHMYAYRLCQAVGLDPEDGVVRVSLLHYNTPDEVDRLIAALEGIRS